MAHHNSLQKKIIYILCSFNRIIVLNHEIPPCNAVRDVIGLKPLTEINVNYNIDEEMPEKNVGTL